MCTTHLVKFNSAYCVSFDEGTHQENLKVRAVQPVSCVEWFLVSHRLVNKNTQLELLHKIIQPHTHLSQ